MSYFQRRIALGGFVSLAAVFAWMPGHAVAATYEPGYGAVPFYTFEDETLNDRMNLRVNVRSGNLLFTASDVGIKGTGIDLSLERHYNSMAGVNDQMGYGWRQSLSDDITLTFLADGNAEFRAPTGFVALFVKQADGSFKAPLGLHVRMSRAANNEWLLTYNDSQTRLRFPSAGGDVQLVEDKNANKIDPVYSGGEMTSVIDSQGRTTALAYSGSRLTKITDPSGRTYLYAYTGSDLTSYTDRRARSPPMPMTGRTT